MTNQELQLKVTLLTELLSRKGIHNRKQLQEALDGTEKIDISPFTTSAEKKKNVG